MEKEKSSLWDYLWAFFKVIFILIGIIMTVALLKYGLVEPIISMEHYKRVYKNPITVTATVTDFDSYDDDGDTDYRSYVSYGVDGIYYKDKKYENKDSYDELTPLGSTVKIEVSPENPPHYENP